jgi:UDP-N-acetylglucosamine 2-epimerase (non-hydrolysing)/GDP/UDP-N,N'-diacetylbacillosamine 2-epimerase (hydrolysing)
MLAGAIAAVHLNIPVAHVHGGDVSGTIDELVRHAISKLSHVHFPATEDAGARLLRMGERPEHIHLVGAPGLDYLSHFEPIPDGEIEAGLHVDLSRPFVLFTQHPVTAELDAGAQQMETSLRALEAVNVQVVATYPNSDAGGRAMIEVLKRWADRPWLSIVPSLGQRRFASLLKRAAAMVGNSSSGIIEAPFFGVPVVNIGSRQAGRLRAENVLDAPHDQEAIRSAVACALNDETFRARARAARNPYGDGHAGEQIVEVLVSLEIGPQLLKKQIAY